MPTHYRYKTRQNAHGTDIKSHTYRALRRSNSKEMYIVRYADYTEIETMPKNYMKYRKYQGFP